ncbi:MAG TPA: DUF255 domain-containing protein [Saprospiraceae bacterium]|nr:DUF255 domain-containing protein [Saprospiraceae bacterium]
MKKLSFFVLLLPFLAFAFVASPHQPPAKKIHWYTWDEMVLANAKNPKPIFVDVYTDWCGWCKKMDRSTFRDAKVVKILTDDFYAVKLDAEQRESILFQGTEFKYVGTNRQGHHELAAALLDGQMSFPTTVMLTPQYERIAISPGYKDAQTILKELEYVTSRAYEK